jgi:hypothetical protein
MSGDSEQDYFCDGMTAKHPPDPPMTLGNMRDIFGFRRRGCLGLA